MQPRRIRFEDSFIETTRSPSDPPGLQSRQIANHSMSCKTAGIEYWRLTIPKQHRSPYPWSSIFNHIGLQSIQWICKPDSHVSLPWSDESYRQHRRIRFEESFIEITRSPSDHNCLQSRRIAIHSMICKTAGIEYWRLTIPPKTNPTILNHHNIQSHRFANHPMKLQTWLPRLIPFVTRILQAAPAHQIWRDFHRNHQFTAWSSWFSIPPECKSFNDMQDRWDWILKTDDTKTKKFPRSWIINLRSHRFANHPMKLQTWLPRLISFVTQVLQASPANQIWRLLYRNQKFTVWSSWPSIPPECKSFHELQDRWDWRLKTDNTKATMFQRHLKINVQSHRLTNHPMNLQTWLPLLIPFVTRIVQAAPAHQILTMFHRNLPFTVWSSWSSIPPDCKSFHDLQDRWDWMLKTDNPKTRQFPISLIINFQSHRLTNQTMNLQNSFQRFIPVDTRDVQAAPAHHIW